MRLVSLEIAGFRGFSRDEHFDLDADAVVVVGTNGNGKTSLFDAVLWATCGQVPRLGKNDANLINRFCDSGQARVVLRIRNPMDQVETTITRVFDGQDTRVNVESLGESLFGLEAETRLLKLFWPGASNAPKPMDALATVLTRSVYLQQDLVRQFIDSVTVQERFAAVSELVGAGRVSELQIDLEKSKAAWTRATNLREKELEVPRARLANMESRLADFESNVSITRTLPSEDEWLMWWTTIGSLGVKVPPPPQRAGNGQRAIDSAIRELESIRHATERRLQGLAAIRSDIAALASVPRPDKTELEQRLQRAKHQLNQTQAEIAKAQEAAARHRQQQVEVKEKRAQLRTLATLALENLGQNCPVCDQDYDHDATRRRLQEFINDDEEGDLEPFDANLPQLLSAYEEQERLIGRLNLEIASAIQASRNRVELESRMQSRLEDLGINRVDTATIEETIDLETTRIEAGFESLARCQLQGEDFALRFARASEEASVDELREEISRLRQKTHNDEKEISSRQKAGEEAQRIIEALREATSAVVKTKVKEIEPLLREMYGRIDVHPAFRVVQFFASFSRGKGQLSTVVSDPIANVECDVPGAVLSSSQMNALAVCTFLSLNLGMLRPPFEAALLDDPLQSLDDINLLGLIDLLRRTKDQRQLCVSTHDKRFGALLSKKLRPRTAAQRTVVIELDGWDRQGPHVSSYDAPADPVTLRLLA